MDTKKSKKPTATFGLEINILSFKKKNPSKINAIGKSKENKPKYPTSKSFTTVKDSPLLEKERRNKSPPRIRPKAKIE